MLYDVSTSHRRKRFVSNSDIAGSGAGGQGSLVHIATSPLAVIGRFAARGDAGQQQRAAEARAAVLAGVADPSLDRDGRRQRLRSSTTLGRLPVDDVARLVWHSYVLTRVSLWVVHGVGSPLSGAASGTALAYDRFVALCRPSPGGR